MHSDFWEFLLFTFKKSLGFYFGEHTPYHIISGSAVNMHKANYGEYRHSHIQMSIL